MIIGAHCVISSTRPKADLAFFRKVLRLPAVDEGGYVICALPPAELSVHPARKGRGQEIFLMCDDIQKFVAGMKKRKIACSAVQDQGWGIVTQLKLPGGGKLSVYQPRHRRPKWR